MLNLLGRKCIQEYTFLKGGVNVKDKIILVQYVYMFISLFILFYKSPKIVNPLYVLLCYISNPLCYFTIGLHVCVCGQNMLSC